jgi:GDPmannose 4,6-dehydratase
LTIHRGDLIDDVCHLIRDIHPDEIYNLAAISDVKTSFDIPSVTGKVNGIAVIRILETIRQFDPTIKFYQASTSELFGDSPPPQNENTPMCPRSPYAVAKLYAYWSTINYREAYGLFACNGILFNHESPARGDHFVTKKITKKIADIVNGKDHYVELGNLNAKRDWGHSSDYVKCMWKMLQQEHPDDFVIATGQTRTVREFAEKAFSIAGYRLKWLGKGLNEIGVDQDGKTRVIVNECFFRPTEVEHLCGDPTKARRMLNWNPTITFDDLVKEMVNFDLQNGNHQIN